MKEEIFNFTEEELEAVRQHNYLLGQAVALEQKAHEFRKLSGELFAKGQQDEKARWYRHLAEELEEEAPELRKKAGVPQ
jgi:hypothetical protein